MHQSGQTAALWERAVPGAHAKPKRPVACCGWVRGPRKRGMASRPADRGLRGGPAGTPKAKSRGVKWRRARKESEERRHSEPSLAAKREQAYFGCTVTLGLRTRPPQGSVAEGPFLVRKTGHSAALWDARGPRPRAGELIPGARSAVVATTAGTSGARTAAGGGDHQPPRGLPGASGWPGDAKSGKKEGARLRGRRCSGRSRVFTFVCWVFAIESSVRGGEPGRCVRGGGVAWVVFSPQPRCCIRPLNNATVLSTRPGGGGGVSRAARFSAPSGDSAASRPSSWPAPSHKTMG